MGSIPAAGEEIFRCPNMLSLSPCQTVTTFLATCGDIRRVITRRISPRMATRCCSKVSVKFFYGCHTTCLRYFRQNSNRLLRYCTSFFDICTSSATSIRDSFDIVRDYYVFVRVNKSFARSVSSLYDIV